MATLAEVRTAALQRANMEVDTGVEDEDRFVTDAEVDRLINLGYKELYGYLVRQGMHRADGSASYALPDDFYALLTIHRVEDGVGYMLSRHDHRTRPRTDLGSVANTYRIVGARVAFNPVPDDASEYEVRYVPIPGTLAADADELDGVLGWEEYVILYVAGKLLQKEGSFNAAEALRNNMRELLERVKDEAQAAELTEGTVVQNVRNGDAYRLPGDFTTGGRPRGWWW
jgi:hypothetical protein